MGWAVGYDGTWDRDIGYGVPALCDHPRCNAQIDRGLSYVCCEDQPHGGDIGCGLFFCSEHKRSYRADHGPMCARCATYKPPYKHPKPDHPEWVEHKLTDPSWQDWRDDHPEDVKRMQRAQLLADFDALSLAKPSEGRE